MTQQYQQPQRNGRLMLCGDSTRNVINATQEQKVYDTTGIIKSELRVTNDDTWQLDEPEIRPEESR